MECFRKLVHASAGPAAAAPPSRRWLIKVRQTDSSLEGSRGGGGGERGLWILQLLSAKRNKSPVINFPRFCSFLFPLHRHAFPIFAIKDLPSFPVQRQGDVPHLSGLQEVKGGPLLGPFCPSHAFGGKSVNGQEWLKWLLLQRLLSCQGSYSAHAADPPAFLPLLHL